MESDFSGYATRSGLKCSDGRIIHTGAFKDNDGQKVPLVWQHQHNSPDNILGHAKLEDRPDGTYAHCFFNGSKSADDAKTLVQHGDVEALSIYANKLVQQGQNVVHGAIQEVSIVLAGANPGAYIDNINLQHGDTNETLEDEAIIYTDDSHLVHADSDDQGDTVADEDKPENKEGEEQTVADIFESLTDEQKTVVYAMLGEALESDDDSEDKKSEDDDSEDKESDDDKKDPNLKHSQEGSDMSRNVFEGEATNAGPTLSHAQIDTIVADAQKTGSFKESFLSHAVEYGIENIDVLFPDAKNVTPTPEIIGRNMEWVASVINGTKHSPFSRIKSTAVDLTADEARAKGYVKATLKKEEVVKLLKRVTTPTTIYKKQKLDRDDIVDITDLDVVAWLKAEMRVMLDEELARAVLLGDGREVEDEDKINEDNLRPIATDDPMYAHPITLASNVVGEDMVEAIVRSRSVYKGTGTPTLYTTEAVLVDLLLAKDKMGRRLYNSEMELASAMRVSKIVAVEAMEEYADFLGIIVNIADYTMGADKGGNISMFDDFDIDYNQYKYLIETRVSGALTKPKSALVIKRMAGDSVTPTAPTFDGVNKVTIPTVTGVKYSVDGTSKTGSVTITGLTEVVASPKTGYYFPSGSTSDWVFDLPEA